MSVEKYCINNDKNTLNFTINKKYKMITYDEKWSYLYDDNGVAIVVQSKYFSDNPITKYKINQYIIIMNDYDDFLLSIKQDVNRPNNPDDDQLIQEYMNNNYYGHSYRVIDLDELKYFKNREI